MLNFNFTHATVGFLVKNDQVLLGLRKKVSNNLGQDLYVGVGGKLEQGETIDECLVREFQEEIKVTPVKYKYMGTSRFIFPSKEKWCMIGHAYLITEWTGELEETESIKPVWFDKDNLPKNQMWEDNLIWLPKLLNSETFDYTFLYDDNSKLLLSVDANQP